MLQHEMDQHPAGKGTALPTTFNIKIEVPSSVDDVTLSHLLAAVNSGQGVTILTPTLVHLDVNVLDVERVT